MRHGIRSYILCVLAFFAITLVSASPFDYILNKNGALGKVDSSADSYEYVGSNVIASGHVIVRSGNLLLTADKAIFNLDMQDVELTGHVSFSMRGTTVQNMTEAKYNEALRDPFQIVKKIQT